MFIMNVSDEARVEENSYKSLDSLVADGARHAHLQPLQWKHGQGEHQIAFLTATSGTSGKQVSCRDR